jgi:hypothetical protein
MLGTLIIVACLAWLVTGRIIQNRIRARQEPVMVVGHGSVPGRLHEMFVAVWLGDHGEEGLVMLQHEGRCVPWLAMDEETALGSLPGLKRSLAGMSNPEFRDVQIRRYGPWDHIAWCRRNGA